MRKEVLSVVKATSDMAKKNHNECVMTEHLLLTIAESDECFKTSFEACGGDIDELKADLEVFFAEQPSGDPVTVTEELNIVISQAMAHADLTGSKFSSIFIIDEILKLEDSFAAYLLLRQVSKASLLRSMGCEESEEETTKEPAVPFSKKKKDWKSMVTCLNDAEERIIIGRDQEMQRTVEILCRKNKNNPIHIGDAGVGKTAIVYGLVQKIKNEEVPDTLIGKKVYLMDMTSMVAGTQFRGEFEEKVKAVLEGAKNDGNAIIYIDEIHNLVGAGATSGSTIDGSEILKPYLEDGKLQFIGSTTPEEYKKTIEKSSALRRRFQNVDVPELSIEEATEVMMGLKSSYEEFHGVKYSKAAIESAVTLSAKFVTERRLPDKSIDLIDEAGAKAHIAGKKSVSEKDIETVLCKTCKIPKQSIEKDDVSKLRELSQNIKSDVFGQDEAIDKIVETVQMAKVGLMDDTKPIGSFLFVGPTGVGKTEIAKTLANKLDIKLIRFDMSEYSEEHSVAKLVGAPAGYVGYEDGGLLTEAVRENPHCVLLFDEIEKAHPKVYNMMLQIMDYATLTDTQGRKADFRNAIILMTSNAGASLVSKSKSIGFGSSTQVIKTEDLMSDAVNKTFTPEFRNRLSGTVYFNALSEEMANLITNKKIKELSNKLALKSVNLTISDDARAFLTKKGITAEYGAREIDRVISSTLKPLITKEILFGKLSKGGTAKVILESDEIKLA